MALAIITITDTANGLVDIHIQFEPAIEKDDTGAFAPSPAQNLAATLLGSVADFKTDKTEEEKDDTEG